MNMHTLRGSSCWSGFLLAAAIIFAPQCALALTNTWSTTASLNTPRDLPTATLLQNGKVLVVGGYNNSNALNSAEIFDPSSNTWIVTANMSVARGRHSATLLGNGKVLVAGGSNSTGNLASAEIYDPATNTWTPTGALTSVRVWSSATLLPSGKVLVIGGSNSFFLNTAETYDPSNNTWTAVASMATGRYNHTATLLPSGNVLVAAGYGFGPGGNAIQAAEVYNPTTNVWSSAGNLAAARYSHTATLLPNGLVLIAGGSGNSSTLSSAELYNPTSNTWSAAPGLSSARQSATATLLPSGILLVAGGYGSSGMINSAELYNPATNLWALAGAMTTARAEHTATLLTSGQILTTGGAPSGMFGPSIASSELYDPTTPTWSAAGSLNSARYYHVVVPLANGKVLTAAGANSGGFLASAELFDPTTNTWSFTGSLASSRLLSTGTLLTSGKVLVVGGSTSTGVLASAELYDPASGTWDPAASMASARLNHTATLLSNGKVLVAGGQAGGGPVLSSAELYDSAANSWSPAGNMATPRYQMTATLQANGQVLVAAGSGSIGNLNTAELYDPATNSWHAAANLATARTSHSAVLLPSGKVLVAGGSGGAGAALAGTEIYDPSSNVWAVAGNLNQARSSATAIVLPNGQVLMATGVSGGITTTAELFTPATNVWSSAGNLATARQSPLATLLPSGKIIVVGGFGSSGAVGGTELFALDLGIADARRPTITVTPTSVSTGSTIGLTGTGFTGDSSAAGDSPTSSPTNFPLLQLRRIDNGQISWLSTTAHTKTTLTSAQLLALSGGPYQIAMFVNALPSKSQTFMLTVSNHVVTPSAGSGGSISPATTQTVADGSAVSFTLAPNTGYSAVGASGACGGILSGAIFTTNAIVADCDVVANFTPNSYTVTAAAGTHGTISPASQPVTYGGTAGFTVTPELGYVASLSGDTCTVTQTGSTSWISNSIVANCAVTASFALQQFAVTAANATPAHGTITPPTQTVNYGSSASFTVMPDVGYSASLGGDNCTVSNTSGTTWMTNAITSVCTVTATFTLKNFNVTTTTAAGAHGTISPPTQNVDYGNTAIFTVTPDPVYAASLTGDTCSVTQTGVNTWASNAITAPCVVTATFAIPSYTVTAAVIGANGTISPAAQVASYEAIFVVTANPGFTATVIGDTCTVNHAFATIWMTAPLSADCAVTASFSDVVFANGFE